MNCNIPWVEAYRPTQFQNVVLDGYNQVILTNILNQGEFPNLLLYGPPGTGKTTTIVNLIHEYQTKYDVYNNDSIIHLNASDDRGIDVIREQIASFANTQSLFQRKMKFIIFDEADYLTDDAQRSLCCILQTCALPNVKFCLICNYISNLADNLQNEFIKLHFNQMPIEKTLELLIEISQKENAGYNREGILEIIAMYGTDIRSMINHMQSNKQLSDDLKCRIEPVLYDAIIDNNVPNCEYRIRTICRQHRIHLSQFFKKMFHHIICNYLINNNLLSFMENVLHNENQTIWMKENYLKYVLANIRKLCGKL